MSTLAAAEASDGAEAPTTSAGVPALPIDGKGEGLDTPVGASTSVFGEATADTDKHESLAKDHKQAADSRVATQQIRDAETPQDDEDVKADIASSLIHGSVTEGHEPAERGEPISETYLYWTDADGAHAGRACWTEDGYPRRRISYARQIDIYPPVIAVTFHNLVDVDPGVFLVPA